MYILCLHMFSIKGAPSVVKIFAASHVHFPSILFTYSSVPNLSLMGNLVFFSNFHSCLQTYPCWELMKSDLTKTVCFFGWAGYRVDVKTNLLANGSFCCPIQQLEVVNNRMINRCIVRFMVCKGTMLLIGRIKIRDTSWLHWFRDYRLSTFKYSNLQCNFAWFNYWVINWQNLFCLFLKFISNPNRSYPFAKRLTGEEG